MIAILTATLALPACGDAARQARRYLAALGALRGADLAGHRAVYVDAPPCPAGVQREGAVVRHAGVVVVLAGPDPAGLAGTAWRLPGGGALAVAAVPAGTAEPDPSVPLRLDRLTITGTGPVPVEALPAAAEPAA